MTTYVARSTAEWHNQPLLWAGPRRVYIRYTATSARASRCRPQSVIRYATSASPVNMGSRNQRPWPFESHWRERLTLAIKVTSDLQDRILRSPNDFSTGHVVAVLTRIFSRQYPTANDWHRPVDEWLSLVGPPENECTLLHRGLDTDRAAVAVGHLCGIVSVATASWLGGSILDPSAEAVANDFLKQLAEDKIITVQYG